MQLLKIFISERLSAAAEEIFAAVQRTITEYEQDCDGLKQLLCSHMRISAIKSRLLTVSQSPKRLRAVLLVQPKISNFAGQLM